MGLLKQGDRDMRSVAESFEDYFDLGWRFVPQKNEKGKSKITDYEVKSPSGRIYSLCEPIKVFNPEAYDPEEFVTEFDYEVFNYNFISRELNKEKESLSEIIELLDPLGFQERLKLYKKFNRRVD